MRRRVESAPVARLATVTPDGHPHLVPCCFSLQDEVVYSAVDAKPKSTLALKRLANLRCRPEAALLVDHYDDDWSTLWWVRLDGHGRLVDDDDERRIALDRLADKYHQYRVSRPPGAVIALDIFQWRAWP